MPNCFQLTSKSAPEAGPVKLVEVDRLMCEHFNAPCDPVKWHSYWYDIIGFAVACGRSLKELIVRYNDAWMTECLSMDYHLCEIAMWLDENFTTDAWAEIGRR